MQIEIQKQRKQNGKTLCIRTSYFNCKRWQQNGSFYLIGYLLNSASFIKSIDIFFLEQTEIDILYFLNICTNFISYEHVWPFTLKWVQTLFKQRKTIEYTYTATWVEHRRLAALPRRKLIWRPLWSLRHIDGYLILLKLSF